jgi:hypothetical protein
VRWPWVSVRWKDTAGQLAAKRLQLEHDVKVHAQEAYYLREQLESTKEALADSMSNASQLFVEKAYMAETLETQRVSLANLRVLCNEQQTKLKDALEPPCSSEDLKQTLRRLAFLQTEVEALERVKLGLEEQVTTWRGKAEARSLPW